MRALGRRQQRMLLTMAVAGHGRWPVHVKFRAADIEVLRGLRLRGLVTTANMWSKLTDEGQRIAADLAAKEG